MRKEFSQRLTLVRKEKGLSQKQAAAELDISQALLSHYEKGIRECGLDFVVRAAGYYGVSADFLLGISAVSAGRDIPAQELPEPGAGAGGRDIVSALGRRVVFNGVDVLCDAAVSADSRELTLALNNYLYLTVYRALRMLYAANPKNEESFFMVPGPGAPYLTDAAVKQAEAEISIACTKLGAKAPALGQRVLEEQYGTRAAGLLNLVKNAENLIKK